MFSVSGKGRQSELPDYKNHFSFVYKYSFYVLFYYCTKYRQVNFLSFLKHLHAVYWRLWSLQNSNLRIYFKEKLFKEVLGMGSVIIRIIMGSISGNGCSFIRFRTLFCVSRKTVFYYHHLPHNNNKLL